MKKSRLKRPWAAYKYRKLILYLIGLGLILICIAPVPVHYWYRLQVERNFSFEANSGKTSLEKVETLDDRGQWLLTLNTAHEYGDPFPTSGPYDPNWLQPGFYGSPRAPTLLVHALARGNIVIYYDQPQERGLAILKDWAALFRGEQDGIIVVAYPGLGSELVLTAWGRRLRLPQFDPSAAAAFIDAFRGRGPENRSK